MEITSVKVRRSGQGDKKVLAAASICFDEQFVVHGLRIVEGANGRFVSMPARKTGQGDYRDIAHPVTAETRDRIQGAVLQAYEEWVSQREDQEEVREEALAGA